MAPLNVSSIYVSKCCFFYFFIERKQASDGTPNDFRAEKIITARFGSVRTYFFTSHILFQAIILYLQFKRKLTNQTWENGEKPNLGSKFGPHSFFREFYLCQMLDIVASYHRQGKLMIQTHKNGEKPHFRPGLGMLGSNSSRDFF